MENFRPSDEVDIDEEARAAVVRRLLTRPRLEASAYRTCNERHLQIYLEDVNDEHWPVWLTVVPDEQGLDLAVTIRALLTERFPECPIPPLTVVRR